MGFINKEDGMNQMNQYNQLKQAVSQVGGQAAPQAKIYSILDEMNNEITAIGDLISPILLPDLPTPANQTSAESELIIRLKHTSERLFNLRNRIQL